MNNLKKTLILAGMTLLLAGLTYLNLNQMEPNDKSWLDETGDAITNAAAGAYDFVSNMFSEEPKTATPSTSNSKVTTKTLSPVQQTTTPVATPVVKKTKVDELKLPVFKADWGQDKFQDKVAWMESTNNPSAINEKTQETII